MSCPLVICKTTKDAAIWSQIGDKMVTVGEYPRRTNSFSVTPVAADIMPLPGCVAFIDKGHLESVQRKQK